MTRKRPLRSFISVSQAANAVLVEPLEARRLLATFIVNNVNDTGGVGGASSYTLRQAINAANATTTPDTITFNFSALPPGTNRLIRPTSALPTITQPLTIDGRDPNSIFSAFLLNGSLAGNTQPSGLTIQASNVTIIRLSIVGFGGSGILIASGTNNRVIGSSLGIVDNNQAVFGNGLDGITVMTAGNTIGGTAATDRNVIAGNGRDGILVRGNFSTGTGNVVVGNYVGIKRDGVTDAGNALHGVSLESSGNRVGFATLAQGGPGARNVISGNAGDGVHIERTLDFVIGDSPAGSDGYEFGPEANDNVVAGNYIGTNAAGTAAVGNDLNGVQVINGLRNAIGSAQTRNVIAGNARRGVNITAASNVADNLRGTSSDNVVIGNYVGLSASGQPLGNVRTGVAVVGAPNADVTGNRVGGPTAGERNVIGSNSSPGVGLADGSVATSVFGNYIGTDPTGTKARPNLGAGVAISDSNSNVIGGGGAGQRNVISGNNNDGVLLIDLSNTDLFTAVNTLDGNYIGLSADGTRALGNSLYGVRVIGAYNNRIGVAGSGINVISGNGLGGIGIGVATSDFTAVGTTDSVAIDNNRIGTNAAGTAAVPNNGPGVYVTETSSVATTNVGVGASFGVGNLISGNGIFPSGNLSGGVRIENGPANTVLRGNRIGTDVTGIDVLGTFGNQGPGVYIANAATTTVGGPFPQDANVIAGNNGNGITIVGDTAVNTSVANNFIGTDPTGTIDLGNGGAGVTVSGNSNTIDRNITIGGTPNTIAFNRTDGVNVLAGRGVEITRNRIYANGDLGIDLANNGVTLNDNGDADVGPNELQNFPGVIGATTSGGNVTVSYVLGAAFSTVYRIDFYAVYGTGDPTQFGEGNEYLGSTTVTTSGTGGASGSSTFSLSSAPGATRVTGTLTRTSDGSTSEFGLNQAITSSDLVVTNTNDAGTGSLRQAILNANANADANLISFAIPSAASYVITPLTALPIITSRVTIDATTQSGFAGTPIVELVGTSAGAVANGLVVTAGGSTIRGLVIRNFAQNGILLQTNDNNVVVGNYIGTDRTGTIDRGNGNAGVFIYSGSDGNRIGGVTAADRNVLSGNADGITVGGGTGSNNNLIRGNYIGTDATGTADLGNAGDGLFLDATSFNQIGGSVAGAGNVISGNGDAGVFIQSATATNNQVLGNRIGTNAAGTAGIGNGRYGVWLHLSAANRVGIPGGAAPNTIAFNGQQGVLIDGAGTGQEVIGNAIFSNGGLGIDLGGGGVTANDPLDADAGANGLQNFPVLTAAVPVAGGNVAVSGYVLTKPNTVVQVQVYASAAADPTGYGEGQQSLGFAYGVTDAAGRLGFSFTAPLAAAAGQVLTATATTNDGTSEFSLARVIAADATAPTAAPSSASFDVTPELLVQFGEDVSPNLSVDDLMLTNLTTGDAISPGDYVATFDYATNTAVFSFTGYANGVLPDGRYRATVAAAAVSDLAGNALPATFTQDFTFLPGDANRDGTVNFDDLLIVAQNYGQTGRTFSQGNFDFSADGLVSFDDLLIIAQRYGTTLPTLVAARPLHGVKEPTLAAQLLA